MYNGNQECFYFSLTWGLGTNHLTFKERRFLPWSDSSCHAKQKSDFFYMKLHYCLFVVYFRVTSFIFCIFEKKLFFLWNLAKKIAPLLKSKLAVLLLNLILQILLYNFYLLLYTVNENDLWQEWPVQWKFTKSLDL